MSPTEREALTGFLKALRSLSQQAEVSDQTERFEAITELGRYVIEGAGSQPQPDVYAGRRLTIVALAVAPLRRDASEWAASPDFSEETRRRAAALEQACGRVREAFGDEAQELEQLNAAYLYGDN